MNESAPREGILPQPDHREADLLTGFTQILESRQRAVNSLLCVGLDPVIEKLSPSLREAIEVDDSDHFKSVALEVFSRRIIEATNPSVSAFKPNIAFWERFGEEGVAALKRVIDYSREVDPSIPIILDAKRADIGDTNKGYADMLKNIGADAITVNPYFGIEGQGALDPFLSLGDKGVIILVRTSNKEASRMQDVIVKDPDLGEVPYYMMVANLAERARQKNPNVGIVVGATAPQQLREARAIFKGPILVPGLGKQGGMPEDLVGAFDENGLGVIAVNASGIIHASSDYDFQTKAGQAAIDWRDRINAIRQN